MSSGGNLSQIFHNEPAWIDYMRADDPVKLCCNESAHLEATNPTQNLGIEVL